tara:strand:- start:131 stop:334 length:204 start_codon:yes stop_codon:yes gene_type:complete
VPYPLAPKALQKPPRWRIGANPKLQTFPKGKKPIEIGRRAGEKTKGRLYRGPPTAAMKSGQLSYFPI